MRVFSFWFFAHCGLVLTKLLWMSWYLWYSWSEFGPILFKGIEILKSSIGESYECFDHKRELVKYQSQSEETKTRFNGF